jgi:hypothetical protein
MPHLARTTRFAWLAVPPAVVLATTAGLVLYLPTRAAAPPAGSPPPAASSPPAQATTPAPGRMAVARQGPRTSGPSREPAGKGSALSARARAGCAAAASACADLTDHLTWLQADGRIIYGPVPMEPGGPGDPTPRGIFRVAWKAGPYYISTSYGVPIPYAVFFAPGGIAFHEGSLTTSSHGCIHLTMAAARFYNEHLPVGAEVAVF